jgi:hypothetical protein
MSHMSSLRNPEEPVATFGPTMRMLDLWWSHHCLVLSKLKMQYPLVESSGIPSNGQ